MPITHIKTPITNIVSGWLSDHADTMPDDVKDQFQCLVNSKANQLEQAVSLQVPACSLEPKLGNKLLGVMNNGYL